MLVPDTLTWDVKIPSLHTHRVVATIASQCYALLTDDLRDDVVDAKTDTEWVWTLDDEIDGVAHWDPALPTEI